jgi:hypothetical protein
MGQHPSMNDKEIKQETLTHIVLHPYPLQAQKLPRMRLPPRRQPSLLGYSFLPGNE